MKILLIGGMHGNEPLGPAVVRLFNKKPVKNIEVVLANEFALRGNCRFVKQDLNRSFPGDKDSLDYESKRAAELLVLCNGYDVVFDFHNTHCPDNDCSFVGQDASPLLYDVSALLDIKRIIVADYECINKYANNCISIEISLNSAMMDANRWYIKLKDLAKGTGVPVSSGIDRYKFVYRMTLEDCARLKLGEQNFKAFQPLNERLAKSLGVTSPAYPIFINDKYTPYNYGGLLNKLDV